MVRSAMAEGYRHLDSAADYGNESEVGEGLQAALSQGFVSRDELWVTSKLWNTYHRPEHVRAACERRPRGICARILVAARWFFWLLVSRGVWGRSRRRPSWSRPSA